MNEEKKRINWKAHIIATIICLIIGFALFLAFFLSNKNVYGALNGTGFAGIILLGFGGLAFVAKEGFFDFAGYGFRQLGTMIFGRVPNAYNDYPSYREFKEEKRKKQSNYFVPALILGALFLLAYLILKLASSF